MSEVERTYKRDKDGEWAKYSYYENALRKAIKFEDKITTLTSENRRLREALKEADDILSEVHWFAHVVDARNVIDKALEQPDE